MSITSLPSLNSTSWYGYAQSVHNAILGGGSGALIVAASNAPSILKECAHYVCDGTADDVEINAAILRAAATTANDGPTGGEQWGKVVLTGGDFLLADSILMRTGVTLSGAGPLTHITENITTVTGAGARKAMIKNFATTTHLTVIENMWLDGRYASGGADVDGISLANGGSLSTYPDVNPDPDHTIRGMLITNLTSDGTQYGISILDDARGTQITNCNIRRATIGVYVLDAPDSHIQMVHIGGCSSDGFYFDGGNWKVFNCKAYYCDGYGFNFSNSRTTAGGNEIQDCENGINLNNCNDSNLGGFVVDTCNTTAIRVACSRVTASFNYLHRRTTDYANCDVGVAWAGTRTGNDISVILNMTNVTSPASGTPNGHERYYRSDTNVWVNGW